MDFLLQWIGDPRKWWNVERVKAAASVVQACGFVVAAFLTYRYTRKLEAHKFEMRLKEIAHANTHRRRVETIEKLISLMGKLLANLEMVPHFIDLFDLNQIPAELVEGVKESDKEYVREKYRHRQYYKSKIELIEATEEALFYIGEANINLIMNFVDESQEVLTKFEGERFENTPETRFTSLGNFKKNFKEVRTMRRAVVSELGKIL